MELKQACTCICTNDDHPAGACARTATIQGGICNECRYYHTFPERRGGLK